MIVGELSIAGMAAIGAIVVVVFGALFFVFSAVRPRVEVGDLDKEAMDRDTERRRLEAAKQAAADRALVEAGSEPEGEFASALAEADAELPAAADVDLDTIDEGEVEVYAPSDLEPPDPIEVGVTRRQVLNRSAIVGTLVGLGAFGGASLAFLWPPPTKGFGGKIEVPTSLDDIKTQIETSRTPFYVAEARTYLQTYKAENESEAKSTYALIWDAVEETGLMPLFQKCPHLGCKVPWCDSSQWFECPCHGSQYNKAGEKRGGPAPRGMDRFAFEVSGQAITIDTGTLVEGPTVGTDTTAQEPEGEHCV